MSKDALVLAMYITIDNYEKNITHFDENFSVKKKKWSNFAF